MKYVIILYCILVYISFIRRRTRVWALAPKPESVDASFRFSHDGGVSSHEAHHKKYILLFVSHQVSGEVRSISVSFTITLSAQPISYHNQHSLTQPYCNFLPFPLIFCPNEICLIVAFTFILLCNKTIRSVLLKARKKQFSHETFLPHTQKKRTSNLPNQQTKSKFVDGL